MANTSTITTVSDKTNEIISKQTLSWLNEIQGALPSKYERRFNTTLNYSYNNYPDEFISAVPLIRYFGVGINGFYNVDDKNGSKPYIPKADELDLYEPIPLRCVPINEDLSDAERSQYRMRVKKSINDQWYWCYYLKVISIIDTAPKITRTNPISKEEEPYELDPSKLHPIPVKPSASGEQTGVSSEVNVAMRFETFFMGSEVLEAINVFYKGDMTKAKISEIGIYSGEDKQLTGYGANNIAFTYTESVYTQLRYKITNTGSSILGPSYKGTRQFQLGNGGLLLAIA